MSILSILAEGRQAAEARMYDRCIINHATTEPAYNPVTNAYDTTPSVIYTGGCRVKLQSARLTGSPDAGDTTHVVLTPEVHVPASVTGIGIGDEVTITAALFNVELIGAVFRVTSLFRDSQATAQRLDCTEVQT